MAKNTTTPNGDRTDTSSSPRPVPRTATTAQRRRILHLLGAGGLAGLAGCFSGLGDTAERDANPATTTGTGTSTDSTKGTLALHEHATIGINFRVASVKDYGKLEFYTRAFEPLTWTTPALDAKPWLVSDWKRTGKFTWEFTLRDGVKYHNGDRLTADRVVEMFEWALAGNAARPVATPQQTNVRRDGVRKVDERVIELTTIQPTVSQHANLSLLPYFGVHPESSLHTEDDYSNLIGTGPFRIENVEEDKHVKLAAFEDYWGGPPRMDALTVRQFRDQNTLALALKGEEIDVGLELPATQLESIKNTDDTKVATQTAPTTGKLLFDLESGPTTDVTFRKALNYAISQEDVITATQNGLGVPARGVIPPFLSISAHDELPRYGPDTAKASSLVEQSSYGGETLVLPTSSRGVRSAKLLAQFLQQALGEIGVDVEIQLVGINTFTERLYAGDGDLFLADATLNGADAPFKEALAPFGSRGRSGPWQNPPSDVQDQLDRLFETIRTRTGSARADALRRAQHIIMEEALVLPLYHEQYLVGMRTGIRGMNWHPLSELSRFERLKYVK